jgi:hypothetical protein
MKTVSILLLSLRVISQSTPSDLVAIQFQSLGISDYLFPDGSNDTSFYATPIDHAAVSQKIPAQVLDLTNWKVTLPVGIHQFNARNSGISNGNQAARVSYLLKRLCFLRRT